MCLIEKEPTHFGDKDSEWVFIDPKDEIRFTHEGGTAVPGSGRRWSFPGGETSGASDSGGGGGAAGTSSLVARKQKEDELPWQLIAILSADMLEKLRRYFQWCVRACMLGAATAALPAAAACGGGGFGCFGGGGGGTCRVSARSCSCSK